MWFAIWISIVFWVFVYFIHNEEKKLWNYDAYLRYKKQLELWIEDTKHYKGEKYKKMRMKFEKKLNRAANHTWYNPEWWFRYWAKTLMFWWIATWFFLTFCYFWLESISETQEILNCNQQYNKDCHRVRQSVVILDSDLDADDY